MAWADCLSADFRAASTVGAAAGTTAANDRRLVETASGTYTWGADLIDTGRVAFSLDHTTAGQNFNLTLMSAGAQTCGALCRVKIPSITASSLTFLRFIAATAGENVVIRTNASTGIIAYSMNNSSSFTNTGITLSAGVVYNIEAFVDWTAGTTHTFKLRVNGVEVVNTTGGTTATTSTTVSFGSAAVQAAQMYMSDCATYNSATQYATVNNWRVIGLEPTADGTHSMTANDFQDDASANLTNSTTTSWQKVDDAPGASPTVTDFVKQVVVRSTSYMEWQLRAMPAGYMNPLLVCLAAAMHPVGATTANAAAFRLISGSNASSEAAIDTSIASNTSEYRKHIYATEPVSAAAWTDAMVKAPLRARFGYDGTSIAAPPALDAVMAFVLAPVATAPVISRPVQRGSAMQLLRR